MHIIKMRIRIRINKCSSTNFVTVHKLKNISKQFHCDCKNFSIFSLSRLDNVKSTISVSCASLMTCVYAYRILSVVIANP